MLVTKKNNGIGTKLQRCENICGTINRTFGNNTRTDTRIKLYKTLAAPILMYGCETWAHSQRGMNKIQTAEMRFLRKVKGCTGLDIIINEDIRADLNIYNINESITGCRNR
jgi:hypothetical protein